jgi:periplasmic divalent cation tolerance protein
MSLLVLSTFEDEKAANGAAKAVVKKRLAACASVVPNINSYYFWKGKFCKAEEALLLAKTTKAKYKKLEAELKKLNPAKVPEIIALRIDGGLKEYLSWVENAGR